MIATLNQFGEQVLFPRVEQIVDDKMQGYTDKILASNDNVIQKLKPTMEEQAAIKANYDNLAGRLEKVESFIERLSKRLDVKF